MLKSQCICLAAFLSLGTSACAELPNTAAHVESTTGDWADVPSDEAEVEGPRRGQCAPVSELICGSYVAGDTSDFNSGSTLELNGYPISVGNYEGPEIAWVFHAEESGEVTWRLIDPTPTAVNHDIFVLSGADGLCAAEHAITRGFNSVNFEAIAGEDYYLLIDGFAGDQGRFEAAVSCDFDAGPLPECPLADPYDPSMEPSELYRCRDAQLNEGRGCGESGYPRGFGAKYAEIFMWDLYPELGVEARDFLDTNFQCLQSAFLEDSSPEMNCDDVAEVGFFAHVGCYLKSGICDVPLSDQLDIISMVEFDDLFHQTGLDAFIEIASACY